MVSRTSDDEKCSLRTGDLRCRRTNVGEVIIESKEGSAQADMMGHGDRGAMSFIKGIAGLRSPALIRHSVALARSDHGEFCLPSLPRMKLFAIPKQLHEADQSVIGRSTRDC